jgi:peptidoglycan/xylan/chitin deacetylase (PgdA/CDA1 family)
MSWPLPVSLLVAFAVASALARLVPRPRLALLGAVLGITALTLYAVTPRGVLDLSIGIVLGIAIGLVVPDERLWHRTSLIAIAVGVATAFVSVRLTAVVIVATAAVNIARHRGERARVGRRAIAIVAAGAVFATGLVLWVGANDPTVQWFGHVTTHGNRSDNRVALTFDDGPDDPYTLQISGLLDERGVKGTFFEVGKAIDARPDITQALFADGHLVGNHSYHHDYWRWLDPRYPELDRTQDAFQRHLGVCPAFFRPPHGQRTPFMLAQVSSHGMHAVTWDVSASDWVSHDPEAVARGILDHVKPGSIILLHDGLDGTVTADRSVVLQALPLILDGLAAKGLQPVRLDELLGVNGYLTSC